METMGTWELKKAIKVASAVYLMVELQPNSYTDVKVSKRVALGTFEGMNDTEIIAYVDTDGDVFIG